MEHKRKEHEGQNYSMKNPWNRDQNRRTPPLMAGKYAIIEAMDKYEKIAQELGVSLKQIDTVLSLTAEGSTIPFIARYRKDMTGI